MSQYPTITVNNIPLLASTPIQWGLRPGVRPTMMEFEITPANYTDLVASLNSGNTVTLKIDLGDSLIIIKNLYFLGDTVGPNDFIKKIILADRRWLWDKHAIYRKYNIRRHVGVKRIMSIATDELKPTVPQIRYAEYSVKFIGQGKVSKWTAKDIVEDIIKDLISYEKDFNSNASGYVFRTDFKKDIPVENLMIDDPGGSALNKALSFIAGAEIYVDYDGRIIIYDKSDIKETQAESFIGESINNAKLFGFGNLAKINKAYLRPKEIHILFHREIELRFDAKEGFTGETIGYPDKTRSMSNVLSLPDWQLNGLVQGTWIDFETVLPLWNAESQPTRVIAEFSMAYLRKAFVPFIDFWSPFLLNGALNPDRDWAARVASIMMHWRRTFKINSYWINRIAHLKAYRIATIDITTGQRAPAIAYANYCQLYTERSFYKNLANTQRPSYISNFPVGLASDSTPIASTNKPAPVKVSLIDGEQGIISLDFLADVYRLREVCIPGIVGEPNSQGNITKITPDITAPASENIVAFDGIGVGQNIPEIVDGFVLPHVTTVILTAIPAAPNDNRQYYKVIKKPSDLPSLKSMEAKGPPMEIIIGAAIETARIRWLDSKSKELEQLFGVGLESPDANMPDIDNLIINKGSNGDNQENYASLDEIARAVAYRIYSALSDRLAGSAATNLRGDITLRGYLDEVSQEVNPDGVAITRISSPTEIPELDLFGLLDENTRNVIMRLAQVGK